MRKRSYSSISRRTTAPRPGFRRVKRKLTRRPRRKMTRRSLVLSGFPQKKLVRLRYVTQTTLNPDNLSLPVAVVRIRANDLYDPEVDLGGQQPMGFDQWMANYDHFCVVGSKIRVQFINPNTGSFTPGMCGIMLSDAVRVGGAGMNTLESILENKNGTRASLTGIAGTSQFNSCSTCVKTCKFSARKFFGHKVVGEDQYRGNAAASPAEQALYEIYFARISGNDPGNITVLITVEYIALFSEPKPLERS